MSLKAFTDLFEGRRKRLSKQTILVYVESSDRAKKAEWVLQHQILTNPAIKGAGFNVVISREAPDILGVDPYVGAILMADIWEE